MKKPTTDLHRQVLPKRLRPIYREAPKLALQVVVVTLLMTTVGAYIGMLVDYSREVAVDCTRVATEPARRELEHALMTDPRPPTELIADVADRWGTDVAACVSYKVQR